METALPSSRHLGKYRVLTELGRGGTASVHLAMVRGESGVSKLVVLKVLLPALAEEPFAVSSFLDEARLAAQLNHPNVVQTYEVGNFGDRHAIVMEYLEGQSLSRILAQAALEGRAMPFSMHLQVLIEALEGLHYAHELKGYNGSDLNIVHRDISPQNVFVTYDGHVKVLDFGIAKAASSSTHTATGTVKGKIAYMAPEQMGADPVDRRADIYSLGCMLWATATGVKLWKDRPDVQVLRAVMVGEVPSPKKVNPRCPDDLEGIVMRALAHDPADRYPTARALQRDLERLAERCKPVKQREIGEFVSNLFAHTRAEIRTGIERGLASLTSADAITSISPASPTSSSFSRVLTPSSSAAVAVEVSETSRGRPRLRRSVVAGVALVAASAAAFWLRTGRTLEPPQPVVAEQAVKAPAAAAASPIEAPPRLEPVVVPAPSPVPDAVAVVEAERDDTKLHSAVSIRHRDRSGGRAVAAPIAAPVAPAVPAPAQPVAQTSAELAPGPTAGNSPCPNPFFVDSNGIKRVRRECM
ncbi:MAG TPA: serine/threonine-protein kinase [Polyangiaceae bacterium]